jgi:hypothetical protein
VDDAAITGLTGTTNGYEEQYFDVGPLEGRSNGVFRFSVLADATGNGDGVNVDDFDVVCAPQVTTYTGAADEYDFDYGTSMAAPYVTGVAALVLSVDPNLSADQVKDRLMESVDPVPSLIGKVLMGGRLNAARAVGAAPPTGGGGSGPAGPPTQKPPHAKSSSLAKNLAAIRKALQRHGLGKRGLSVSLSGPSAGRFTVTLKAKKAVIAKGSHFVRRAGHVALKIRLTGKGGRILRSASRLQATLTVQFTPKAGAGTSRSAKVVLR